MLAPVFVSHAGEDHADVNALTSALRSALGDGLRTFNTSSGRAIPVGANWRSEILAALRATPLVIFWATRAALASREVAFEIGATFAYGSAEIIPCCVHLRPEQLPWSLDDRQALLMDSEEAWVQLAERIAEILDFHGSISSAPLLELAARFRAPADAVSLDAVGLTLEIANNSATLIESINIVGAEGTENPVWAVAINDRSLAPNEAVTIFRDRDDPSIRIAMSWRDITGATRERLLDVPAAGGAR